MSTSQSRSEELLELVATVLIALATVATAWSGYQASRWNGEQATAFSRASAVRIESIKAADLATAQTQVDVATFTQWVDAYAQQQTALADFYFQRFRPEFRPAMDAWVATSPLVNPDAPLTPFAMPQYRLDSRATADRLEAEAETLSATARANVQRATNYVLCVVLFAATLFFAGMSTKLKSMRLRRVLLALGFLTFAGTVAWVATVPDQLLRLTPVGSAGPRDQAPESAASRKPMLPALLSGRLELRAAQR